MENPLEHAFPAAPQEQDSGVRPRPSVRASESIHDESTRITDESGLIAKNEMEARQRGEEITRLASLERVRDRLVEDGVRGVLLGEAVDAYRQVDPMTDIATPAERAEGTQIFLRNEPRTPPENIATPEERAHGMEIYARNEPVEDEDEKSAA